MGKTSGQAKLPGTSSRRTQGTVEKHAAKDVRTLKGLGVVPDGTDALQSVYRALGREFDDAVRDSDGWRKINTAREMLRVREALAPITPQTGGLTIEQILESLPD